jgi:hypothetical protein
MQELRYYLEMLLDHKCGSGNPDCPECRTLQRIYHFMQTEFFATVIYDETPLDPSQFTRSRTQPINRVAAGPRRPHAA